MPYQAFTRSEVERIFRLSEGNAATGGRGAGHAGAVHVSIANAALADRMGDVQGSGLALRTAFLDFKSQVDAALALLNDPANAATLDRFDSTARQGDAQAFVIRNAFLPVPVRMRYAIGGGAQVFPCHHFTLVLRKDLSRPRGMHVVTFFGTMGTF